MRGCGASACTILLLHLDLNRGDSVTQLLQRRQDLFPYIWLNCVDRGCCCTITLLLAKGTPAVNGTLVLPSTTITLHVLFGWHYCNKGRKELHRGNGSFRRWDDKRGERKEERKIIQPLMCGSRILEQPRMRYNNPSARRHQ